jgi:hypothetical protein
MQSGVDVASISSGFAPAARSALTAARSPNCAAQRSVRPVARVRRRFGFGLARFGLTTRDYRRLALRDVGAKLAVWIDEAGYTTGDKVRDAAVRIGYVGAIVGFGIGDLAPGKRSTGYGVAELFVHGGAAVAVGAIFVDRMSGPQFRQEDNERIASGVMTGVRARPAARRYSPLLRM